MMALITFYLGSIVMGFAASCILYAYCDIFSSEDDMALNKIPMTDEVSKHADELQYADQNTLLYKTANAKIPVDIQKEIEERLTSRQSTNVTLVHRVEDADAPKEEFVDHRKAELERLDKMTLESKGIPSIKKIMLLCEKTHMMIESLERRLSQIETSPAKQTPISVGDYVSVKYADIFHSKVLCVAIREREKEVVVAIGDKLSDYPLECVQKVGERSEDDYIDPAIACPMVKRPVLLYVEHRKTAIQETYVRGWRTETGWEVFGSPTAMEVIVLGWMPYPCHTLESRFRPPTWLIASNVQIGQWVLTLKNHIAYVLEAADLENVLVCTQTQIISYRMKALTPLTPEGLERLERAMNSVSSNTEPSSASNPQ